MTQSCSTARYGVAGVGYRSKEKKKTEKLEMVALRV